MLTWLIYGYIAVMAVFVGAFFFMAFTSRLPAKMPPLPPPDEPEDEAA